MDKFLIKYVLKYMDGSSIKKVLVAIHSFITQGKGWRTPYTWVL